MIFGVSATSNPSRSWGSVACCVIRNCDLRDNIFVVAADRLLKRGSQALQRGASPFDVFQCEPA